MASGYGSRTLIQSAVHVLNSSKENASALSSGNEKRHVRSDDDLWALSETGIGDPERSPKIDPLVGRSDANLCGTQILHFTGSTSGPELRSSGGQDSPKINQNRPVPKLRSSWLLQKPPYLPKEIEIMKPIPKPRRSLLETDENTVVKAEGFCFMLTGDGDNEQKETEANKNETTAGASKEVVTDTEKEEENSTSNVEI